MYFYVDGDNCPGNRTIGIGNLKSSDVVKVFYAINNTYYSKENIRESLKQKTKAEIQFISVKEGANAVDFVAAVHIAKDCQSGQVGNIACMVSADKHFNIVKSELNTLYEDIVVNRVETIEEGIMRYYILDIHSLTELHSALEQQYGLKKGQLAYKQLKKLFESASQPAALPEPQNNNPILRIMNRLVG